MCTEPKSLALPQNVNLPIFLNNVGLTIPMYFIQNFNYTEYAITCSPSRLLASISVLTKHLTYQYKLLSCVSGVDLLKREYRFLVSYDLLSLVFSSRLRIKIFLNEYDYIPSIVSIHPSANWWEREAWDLFGLVFLNHPDLRRILTDYGFEGHPLRKDFPLFGYYELRYNSNQKRLNIESVTLSQEYRLFDCENTWR